MTKSTEWFHSFWDEVKKTPQWKTMEETVEGSEWHREANVAVHTTLCLNHYMLTTAHARTDRQAMLTMMTLLFHDFGKPEAEETLEAKDGSGRTYHRYAGHEQVSANEFISFLCEHEELTKKFFARGYGWDDVMKIKFMIEHHLPFGLKNPTKRQNLRNTVAAMLGADEQCFYDQLWSDCCGRISDNHDDKKAAVVQWIDEFRVMPTTATKEPKASAPVIYVLCGVVGAGKTTWTNRLRGMNPSVPVKVISEDDYRMEFWRQMVPDWSSKAVDRKEEYATAWKYCAMENGKGYDAYAKAQLTSAVESGTTLVLDRTNQTRKSRGPWITAAKSKGYKVVAVQFYVSETVMHARQKTRTDKDVPYHRAHQIYMAMETPWFPVEVDAIEIVPPWN